MLRKTLVLTAVLALLHRGVDATTATVCSTGASSCSINEVCIGSYTVCGLPANTVIFWFRNPPADGHKSTQVAMSDGNGQATFLGTGGGTNSFIVAWQGVPNVLCYLAVTLPGCGGC